MSGYLSYLWCELLSCSTVDGSDVGRMRLHRRSGSLGVIAVIFLEFHSCLNMQGLWMMIRFREMVYGR